MARGEVAAVVGVEPLRNAADRPARLALAPDRPSQRQRRLQRARGARRQMIRGDGAAMVVDDDRQPRADHRTCRVMHQDVELGVVGLPDLVRGCRFAPMQQLVALPIGLGALVGEHGHRRVHCPHGGMHRRIARRRPTLLRDGGAHQAVNGRGRAAWPLQRQPLDDGDKLGRQASRLPTIAAPGSLQADQAMSTIAGQPTAQRRLRHARRARDRGECHLVVDDRPQQAETIQSRFVDTAGRSSPRVGGSVTHDVPAAWRHARAGCRPGRRGGRGSAG